MMSRTSLTPVAGGVELFKLRLRVAGDDVGERGFAGARRAIVIALERRSDARRPMEQLARAHKVLLTDKFVEGRRPHPHRQRLDAVIRGATLSCEKNPWPPRRPGWAESQSIVDCAGESQRDWGTDPCWMGQKRARFAWIGTRERIFR